MRSRTQQTEPGRSGSLPLGQPAPLGDRHIGLVPESALNTVDGQRGLLPAYADIGNRHPPGRRGGHAVTQGFAKAIHVRQPRRTEAVLDQPVLTDDERAGIGAEHQRLHRPGVAIENARCERNASRSPGEGRDHEHGSHGPAEG